MTTLRTVISKIVLLVPVCLTHILCIVRIIVSLCAKAGQIGYDSST
jgi:hypothetical protein